MLVYVLNKDGKPLMPCKSVKARILLKQKKAKVIRREPFTIRLLYGSSGYKQPVTLGVDAGAKHIGLSTSTKRKELYSAEVELRTDIVNLIATRKELRRGRRSHKTRYRKARFNNRKKAEDWLAPSIQNRINAHISVIEKVHRILPITAIIVETASFDIQKIKSAEKQGAEYQQGEQLGLGIYPDVRNTYGYLTKNNRILLGLPKEHYVDAYCIAGNLEADMQKTNVFI